MPLKIELKPYERVILGDCVVTNQQRRTRLVVEGKIPILREKDIMTPGRANTPAKRIYLAVQLMYVAKEPKDEYALYLRLAHEMLKSAPGTKPYIDRINNRILTGELYKALRKRGKPVACERECSTMNYAAKAYANVAKETASSRELEANLLLTAAAKLQAAHDSWKGKNTTGLNDALLYNRRLWIVLIDAVTREGNKLPAQVRQNLTRLGVWIMSETFALMTKPAAHHLQHLIKINRGIAAGLRGKS
jgi:flagellar biosynthesis repressor protein FlbT